MTSIHTPEGSSPCSGLNVVELAFGVSELGLGLAGGLPGMLLGDLGATVVRVIDPAPIEIDRDVTWARAWHRDKTIVTTDDPQIAAILAAADVVLAYGSEQRIEQQGYGYSDLSRANRGLVYGRCRPVRSPEGTPADYALLVEARSGFCSQLKGHRDGPILVDTRTTGAGVGFILTSGVLALLRRRHLTGVGGWVETSLYDGMLAMLGTMIGRTEHAPEQIERYWRDGNTFPNFMFRCADGELIQFWFGGKGMYEALIEPLGDAPSTQGYYADQMAGLLAKRAERWREILAAHRRDVWMARLRAAGIPCEPVLAPGEVLSDPHLAAIGLAVTREQEGYCDLMVGKAIDVVSQTAYQPASVYSRRQPEQAANNLLSGVRVVDFSAYLAAPLGAQILADLGAQVIKVEPPRGEAMRDAAYAIAACQRGKRSLAIDLTQADARPVVERLIRWADVVLHNFRPGVPERLGIDAASVARINPQAIYCHASAFGHRGPRARDPGNDGLMQALTGLETAIGGEGNEPIAATWIPIDITGGWLSAIGMLAGLLARDRQGGCGQFVSTSLLGAGMLLQSGVFHRDGNIARMPALDQAQTGYGPGYRLYECADRQWLALVIADAEAWLRLARMAEFSALPSEYVPIRRGPADHVAITSERAIEAAMIRKPASRWLQELQAAGILAELVKTPDHDGFRSGILDDPINRRLGRVTSYDAFDWGRLEQIGNLLRCGPDSGEAQKFSLPSIGGHSLQILEEIGLDQNVHETLLANGTVRLGRA